MKWICGSSFFGFEIAHLWLLICDRLRPQKHAHLRSIRLPLAPLVGLQENFSSVLFAGRRKFGVLALAPPTREPSKSFTLAESATKYLRACQWQHGDLLHNGGFWGYFRYYKNWKLSVSAEAVHAPIGIKLNLQAHFMSEQITAKIPDHCSPIIPDIGKLAA